MKQENVGANLVSGTRRRAGGLAVAAMAVALSNAPSRAQSVINPDANSVLRAMTDQLQALQEFSVEYDTDHEVVQLDGEKIQYSASGRIALSRFAGFHMTRQGRLRIPRSASMARSFPSMASGLTSTPGSTVLAPRSRKRSRRFGRRQDLTPPGPTSCPPIRMCR